MANLPLQPVVNVNVNVTSGAALRNSFALGLIIGNSTIITTEQRVITCQNMQEVADAGFGTTNPEYQAAMAYFAQTPTPASLCIGVMGAEETPVQAATACRAANGEWYGFTVCGATDDQILALAAYADAAGDCIYFANSDTAEILTGGGVLADLATATYKRTIFFYSASEYCAAAALGYTMGANNASVTGGSFTLAYKTLASIQPDDLNTEQVNTIKGLFGNVYITRGGRYNIIEAGTCTDGTFVDELIGIDCYINALQSGVMDLFTSVTKVPQTEAGLTQIINVLNTESDAFVASGFIAPGIWQAAPVLELQTGDALTSGYLFQAEPLANQTPTQRAARTADIYGAVKLAGATQYLTIQLSMNR